jgi:hypothetical protein
MQESNPLSHQLLSLPQLELCLPKHELTIMDIFRYQSLLYSKTRLFGHILHR